jgi:hypothetical protein
VVAVFLNALGNFRSSKKLGISDEHFPPGGPFGALYGGLHSVLYPSSIFGPCPGIDSCAGPIVRRQNAQFVAEFMWEVAEFRKAIATRFLGQALLDGLKSMA